MYIIIIIIIIIIMHTFDIIIELHKCKTNSEALAMHIARTFT